MAQYESILDAALSSSAMQIHHLSNDELKAMLNDDDKIETMVRDLQQVYPPLFNSYGKKFN